MSDDFTAAIVLGVAAGASALVWFVVLGMLALATRPRTPDRGPSTMELGPEPPAVVNFITSGWRLGHEAVPATLLDLAGREIVAIEETEPDHSIVRLKGASPANLTGYERQVLAHVRKLAANDVVPCEALTTGPEDASRQWWKTFEGEVRAHARNLGLSRPRWTSGHFVALGILALFPTVLGVAALLALPTEDNPNLGYLSAGAGVWIGLMAIPRALRADRDTDEGLAAAGRWLGVREHLHEDEVFCDLPPAAVAVWDRYIAYGAALDVSVGAVRALPLGSESEYEAWSSFGGAWHVVRIRYPERFPPGWGRHPALVTFLGLLWGALALFVLTRGVPWMLDGRDEVVVNSVAAGAQISWWNTFVNVATIVVGTVFGFVLLRSLVMVVMGASDVFAREEVVGRILRVRHREKKPPLVAVDDAEHDKVRAWVVRHPSGYPGAGNEIAATITPRLAYVRQFEITHAVVSAPTVAATMREAMEGVEAATALLRHIPGMRRIAEAMFTTVQSNTAELGWSPAHDLAALAGLDVEWVSSTVGRSMHDVTATEPNSSGLAALGGPGEAAVVADDATGRVVLARWPNIEAFDRVGAMLPKFLRQEVPGVGTEAVWLARSTLLARDTDSTAMISVALGLGEPGSRAIAEQLGQRLLT